MNRIYIGDRQLEPDEDDECETCGGDGVIGPYKRPCHECQEDFNDAEPNPYPE